MMIFTNVIKPTHLCNLNCSYCYNDDERAPIMDGPTLERTIGQTFAYVQANHPERCINFVWHGGEPMVAGLDFFEHAVQLQRHFAGETRFINLLQTNGTLLKEKWIPFLRREAFRISISIDGPRAIHDANRVDFSGRGSYDRVIRALQLLERESMPVGLCLVVSKANLDHVDEVYDFMAARSLGFNVIPMMKSGAARDCYGDVGLSPDEYADFFLPLYDRWFEADHDYVYISDFVFKTRAIVAGRPADCIGLHQCADTNISVDPVGDVYSCASVSGHREKRYGNIVETDLAVLMLSPVAVDHRTRRRDPQCAECKWEHVCHGGCPARSYKFAGDHHQRDYYCPSLYRIYEHIAKRVTGRIATAGVPFRLPGKTGPPAPGELESGQARRPLPVIS